jgi:hypothetical protein
LRILYRTVTLTVVTTLLAAACSNAKPAALQLQRGLLTVDNRTDSDWLDVELWINQQYRITVPRIAAGSRFSTTLDVFVAGFGQRFDKSRQRVKDLRLKARQPDGTPVERTLNAP